MTELEVKHALITLDVRSHGDITVPYHPDMEHPDVIYALGNYPSVVLYSSFKEMRWHHMKEPARALKEALVSNATALNKEISNSNCREDSMQEDPPEVDTGGDYHYILSYPKRGGHITLHKKDGCHRRPGVELHTVTYHTRVCEGDFTAKCRACFNGKRAPIFEKLTSTNVVELGDAEVESDDEETSSASSSGGAVTPPAGMEVEEADL